MTDFVTVFETTRWSNGLLADELSRLLVGVVALIGGATALLFLWRKPEVFPRRNLIPSLFITAWAVFWLTMHDFPRMFQHINNLTEAYEKRTLRSFRRNRYSPA